MWIPGKRLGFPALEFPWPGPWGFFPNLGLEERGLNRGLFQGAPGGRLGLLGPVGLPGTGNRWKNLSHGVPPLEKSGFPPLPPGTGVPPRGPVFKGLTPLEPLGPFSRGPYFRWSLRLTRGFLCPLVPLGGNPLRGPRATKRVHLDQRGGGANPGGRACAQFWVPPL